MAFCQIVRPGAPVIFGSFASSMSMQSGAPTFGTPEPQLVLFVLAALARRLGVPFRSGGNFTASKVPDYQAAYESAISFMATMQAGVNFNLHTAGWLEGGLAIGYEKFILDEDQASMAEAYIKGVDITDNGYALDAMLAGGPGQHFLGSPHTLANFENAFWRSELSNNDSFEQWELDGGLDAAQRANVRWKQPPGRVRDAAARRGRSTTSSSSGWTGARRASPTRTSRPPRAVAAAWSAIGVCQWSLDRARAGRAGTRRPSWASAPSTSTATNSPPMAGCRTARSWLRRYAEAADRDGRPRSSRSRRAASTSSA